MNVQEVSDETSFVVPEHVLFREAGDESVLLNLQSEEYFGLDGVGNLFWSMVGVNATFGEIKTQIVQSYDVDELVLEADLRALLTQLSDFDLITVHG